MKKQKQVSAPSKQNQPESGPSAEMVFVAYVSPNQSETISTTIAAALNRSKVENDLILVVTAEMPELRNQKDVAELIERQKGKIVLLEDLKQTLENHKATVVYVADVKTNIPGVLSVFQSNKKIIKDADVYTGVFDKRSGKLTLPFGTKLKKWAYNLWAQLKLPLPLKDYTHTYIFYSKHIVADYFSKSYSTNLSLLCKAAYEESIFQTFPLAQKDFAPAFNRLGEMVKLAIVSRLNWFVIEPLTNPFGKAKPGNAPINRLAFVVVLLAAVILIPKLSFDYGISWDAKRHNMYGYDMLKYFDTDGENKVALDENSSMNEFRYYGEHFNVIAAWLNTYIKPWGEFETRHFLNALYGLLAMLFVSMAAKEIGGWRAGVFALLFIIFSPVFFGHTMNNPTDIPFAAGCSMALFYLLKVLRSLPAPKFSYLLWCGVGIGIAIGSRIGGVVFYAYTGLFMGLSWVAYMRKHGWALASTLLVPYFITGVTIVFIAHIVGISLWPFGQEEWMTNWYVALKKSTSAEFFTYNHELFEGVRMYMANVPWYYLPKFIIINSPLFVLIGFVLLVGLAFTWKKKFGRTYTLIPVVLFVFLFPIVYAEVQSMYYYNGWRHYLFTYPPLIVLTAVGWESLMRLTKNIWVPKIIALAALGMISLPAIWMVKNHPNEVVYFNELVGGTKGAYGNYELDYYSNSCREAAEWIAQQEPTDTIVVAINNEPLTAAYYAQRINPNIQFQWVREYEEGKPFWDYAIYTSRTYSKNELLNEGGFPPKGTVYKVEADGVPIAVVVKRDVYYMPLGYKAFEANLLDSAIYYFTKAAEWNPMDEEAFRMKGTVLFTAQQPDSAMIAFNKAIEIFPENYMAYTGLGLVYVQAKGDLDKGLACFKKANELKYNYTDAYFYAAKTEFARNNTSAGIRYLENSVKRGGNGVPQIYYELGMAYYNTGSYTKSLDNLQLCLTIDPNNKEAYRLLSAVFTKQNKPQQAQACMRRYYELGGK
jgi:tetratricopeptide (TPR) repeat protein